MEEKNGLSQVPKGKSANFLGTNGNHSRGTKFINGSEKIDKELEVVFVPILKSMQEIFYGRFDVKCTSLEDVKKGKPFKIVEFNGVAGEPVHIYEPGYPLLKAYQDVFKQWRIIYRIFKAQKRKNVQPLAWKELKYYFNKHRSQLKLIKKAGK